MKTLYIDCFSGIAGDMMLGALLDLGVDEAAVRAELARLDLDDWTLEVERGTRHGIVGTDVHVKISGEEEGPARLAHPDDHDHRHSHDHLHDHDHDHDHGRSFEAIRTLLSASGLSAPTKDLALRIFTRLAEAEAKLHGVEPAVVHFHEVGATDAIIDVCAVSAALCILKPDRVVSAPAPTPRGHMHCAHGVMPLPAPATLELLRGAQTQQVAGTGEWVTPTGAAILAEIVDSWGPIPSFRVEAIGYGVGDRDPTTRANLLRLILGATTRNHEDYDLQIEANIDDMSPELFGHVSDALFEAGAWDVWLTPIQMKKGRPGTTLSALCAPEQRQPVIDAILRESTTIGVRIARLERYKTAHSFETVETELGPVRVKVARDGGRITNVAPEYEDCKRLARAANVPLKQVLIAALSASKNLTE